MGCASPVVQWISVDLPAPLGPSSPKNSPSSMSSETPRRASVPVGIALDEVVDLERREPPSGGASARGLSVEWSRMPGELCGFKHA